MQGKTDWKCHEKLREVGECVEWRNQLLGTASILGALYGQPGWPSAPGEALNPFLAGFLVLPFFPHSFVLFSLFSTLSPSRGGTEK